MEIRATRLADIERLLDIDGTIASANYLHLEQSGNGLELAWRLEERPLRSKLIEPNAMDDETRFLLKQIVSGADEGLVLVAEHEGVLVGSLLAWVRLDNGTLQVVDLRIDFDHRRNGLGLAMLYRSIQEARERKLRAVTARTQTNNLPAARFLLKGGFELAGLDARLKSNHDLVKEAVTLFWYASLD